MDARLTPARVAHDVAPIMTATLAVLMFFWILPYQNDFIIYWAASHGLLTGANVYDGPTLTTLQVVAGTDVETLLLLNPPPMLLVIAPLSLLPLKASVAVWRVLTILAYWLLARRIVPAQRWPLALFPIAYFLCIQFGQTGFLTAALLIGAALSLDKRPVLSGVLVGLMIIKPHFAVLMPFVLYRSPKAFAAAVATIVVSWGLAEIIFPGSTAAYLHQTLTAPLGGRDFLIYIVRSVYIYAQALGAPPTVAMAVQVVSAIFATGATLVASRRDGLAIDKFAVALAATPLIVPYLYDYDLVFLTLPACVIARKRPWLALALFLVPAYAWFMYPAPIIPLASLVMVGLLLWDGRSRQVAAAIPGGVEAAPEQSAQPMMQA